MLLLSHVLVTLEAHHHFHFPKEAKLHLLSTCGRKLLFVWCSGKMSPSIQCSQSGRPWHPLLERFNSHWFFGFNSLIWSNHSGRLSRAGRERIFNSDNNTLLWENKPHRFFIITIMIIHVSSLCLDVWNLTSMNRNPPTEFKNLKVPTDNGEDRLGSVHTIWNAQVHFHCNHPCHFH